MGMEESEGGLMGSLDSLAGCLYRKGSPWLERPDGCPYFRWCRSPCQLHASEVV